MTIVPYNSFPSLLRERPATLNQNIESYLPKFSRQTASILFHSRNIGLQHNNESEIDMHGSESALLLSSSTRNTYIEDSHSHTPK